MLDIDVEVVCFTVDDDDDDGLLDFMVLFTEFE